MKEFDLSRSSRPTPWRQLVNAMQTIDEELSAMLTLSRVPQPIRNGLQRLRDECTLPVLRRAMPNGPAPRKQRGHLAELTSAQVEDYLTLTRKGGYKRAEALEMVRHRVAAEPAQPPPLR